MEFKTQSHHSLFGSQNGSEFEDINSISNQAQNQINLSSINRVLNSEIQEIQKTGILINSSPSETEIGLKRNYILHEKQQNNLKLIQYCQEYANDYYKQTTSLYLINNHIKITYLHIYDIESGREKEKEIKTPEPLDRYTNIVQLPGGELFCFGNRWVSGITFIMDKNYRFRVLSSGMPCFSASITYFQSSIYCFGGVNCGCLTQSIRFDLDKNRWNKLTPMPQADCYCYSIVVNRNILISRYINKNILIYSIDNDSFQ